jgi:hypothetical protein
LKSHEKSQGLIEYDIFNSSKSKFKMQVNYYNSRLDSWEPFIEKFSLIYSSQAQSKTSSFSELAIVTPLNFNLSEEFIASVSQLNSQEKAMQECSQHKINTDSDVTSNYKIVNMTSRRLIIKRNLKDYRKIIAEKLKN